jgi:hypothetical protein
MFEINVKHKIEDQRLEDLLCGAFEGGSNYWYEITSYVNPNDAKVAHKYLQLPFIEGCGVMVKDAEDEDAKPILLNRESMAKGLKVMSEKYDWHLKNFLEENDDAETSDVFLQCSLFGEIVFG